MRICNFVIYNHRMKDQIQTIVFIGSGNVATTLATAFKKTNKTILQVYSRTEENAKKLGNKLNTEFCSDLIKIKKNADLYIISVPDQNIIDVLKNIDIQHSFVVHTSGTSPISILGKFINYGVFYPLQTLSIEKEVTFNNVPICIEANTDQNLELLKILALTITNNVQQIDSYQRKILHIGAVFVSNFPNYFYTIAEDICQKNNLSFELLKPLIDETANKVKKFSPADSQTGPARRNDQITMNKHLDMLKKYPIYHNLYKQISNEIKKKYHKND